MNREIENGGFSPLIFNTLGGMGPTAQTVYRRLADLIADKLILKLPYCNYMLRTLAQRCKIPVCAVEATHLLLIRIT